MALNHEDLSQSHHGSVWRWQTPRRKVPLLKRRKVQTVRLGGKKTGRRMLVRILRKIRLKWLKLQYHCMLRKLKEYYKNLVKDLMEAGASIETFQQRLFMENTFVLPVGVTFSSYPYRLGSDQYPRSIFIT